MRFFQRKGRPEPITFRQVLPYQARLWYVMAAGLRSIGYAIFCEAVPCALGNSGRQIPFEFHLFRRCGVLRFTFPQEHESHRVHARRCTVLPRSFRIFATSDQ